MKKRKLLAPFITLLAAAVSLAFMLLWGYSISHIAKALLIIVILFYAIGAFVQARIIKFIEVNEEKAREEAEKEGAVIEKESNETEDNAESGEEYTLPPLTGAMPRQEEDSSADSLFRTPQDR